MNIKEQIEKVIKEHGLTNAAVAKMLEPRPTDSSNFGRMITQPSWPTLERIARALGISVVELIDDRIADENQTPTHSVFIDGKEYVPKDTK